MRPTLRPALVNGFGGDPALFVDLQFERRALLFDLGDLTALAPRKILRISDIFVSHAHMDHFVGFDWFLRVVLGREKSVRLFGPPGFIEKVEHKLAAYEWNLVENYPADLVLVVTEVLSASRAARATFRCRRRFRREEEETLMICAGALIDEPAFRVRFAILDHKIPCLAYLLEEKQHVNVWRDRAAALGVPIGRWLRELKQAVLRGDPDETPFAVRWRRDGAAQERLFPLGELKSRLLHIVAGESLAYVTDCIYHEENAVRIVELARSCDFLFIEAMFLEQDITHASAKYHLTARQAGVLAREAGSRRVSPFHFSARYAGEEDRLQEEFERAFRHD